MTTGGALRVAAVLDATGAGAERHGRALGGFLRGGLAAGDSAADAVTHMFAAEDADDGCIFSAPTGRVRLCRVPMHRPDVMTGALSSFHSGGGADMYVFPAGPLGTELASRLAARCGGSILTGVLSASFAGGRLACRCTAYAGQLTGTFELDARPWCIVLDADWDDARAEPPGEHVVEAADFLTSDDFPATPALQDVEPLDAPETRDLETARFLVVAGRGAGSRGGVERIAAAAARMGAAFGVTRPVVMNAWTGPDRQVGVSGTRTAPAVCIVAGASGAPAFLWGVERAGFIAAVDTDDRAPIAGESDVFAAGDAVALVEALADLAGRPAFKSGPGAANE